mgnify:CR=1 FL=1
MVKTRVERVQGAVSALVMEKSSRRIACETISGMRRRVTRSKAVSSLNSRLPLTRSAKRMKR